MKRMNPRWKSPPMWPSGVGSRQPCPRESALRRAAISGNINALPPHHVPTGRSVRVFICANPDDTEAERNALKEHVYPKLRDFCRENYGIEFQKTDTHNDKEWKRRSDASDTVRIRVRRGFSTSVTILDYCWCVCVCVGGCV
uniref:NACHT and WD repeat domain containing 2 n=1 Tax=Seriola dumerili TaxID=41447 RepID=A0A3B4VJE8_SERDU